MKFIGKTHHSSTKNLVWKTPSIFSMSADYIHPLYFLHFRRISPTFPADPRPLSRPEDGPLPQRSAKHPVGQRPNRCDFIQGGDRCF